MRFLQNEEVKLRNLLNINDFILCTYGKICDCISINRHLETFWIAHLCTLSLQYLIDFHRVKPQIICPNFPSLRVVIRYVLLYLLAAGSVSEQKRLQASANWNTIILWLLKHTYRDQNEESCEILVFLVIIATVYVRN